MIKMKKSKRSLCLSSSKWSNKRRRPQVEQKSTRAQKLVVMSPPKLVASECSYRDDRHSALTSPLEFNGEKVEEIKSLLKKCLDDAAVEQNFHQSLLVSNDVIHKFCYMYYDLSPEVKEQVLLYICRYYGVDHCQISKISAMMLTNVENQRASATYLQTEERMRYHLHPIYYHLFKLIGRLHNGVKFLTDMRKDALEFASKTHDDNALYLRDFSNQLRNILAIWFSVGLLRLTRITWETPADILERIAKSEAVHMVRGWTDLKKRLGPDRRCYAFFHNSMPRVPLLLLHVALTSEITESITDIVDYSPRDAKIDVNLSEKTTAMFYSITSTQEGLQGIEFGVHMIRAVAQELRQSIPSLVQFSSLSPIPRFNYWLQNQLSLALKGDAEVFIAKEMADLKTHFEVITDEAVLEHVKSMLDHKRWNKGKDTVAVLKSPLMRLCAEYLYDVKVRGSAYDPVANFHLRNGATLWRINYMADPSVKGINQSLGIMVNYRYFLDELEENSREYILRKTVPVSQTVLAQKCGNIAKSVL